MNPLHNAGDPATDSPDRAAITAKSRNPNPDWDRPVYFPEWRAILDLEPLEPHIRARYAGAIIRYLAHLKTAGERASIAGAKRYLESGAAARPVDREALRWFFLAYRRVRANTPTEAAHPVDVRPPNPMPIPPC